MKLSNSRISQNGTDILSASRSDGFRCDAELHVVDFRQRIAALSEVIRTLDSNGVDTAFIMGLSVKKMRSISDPAAAPVDYYLAGDGPCLPYATDWRILSAWSQLPSSMQNRLIPFVSGFVSTDVGAIDELEALIEHYPGIGGIGECLLRHDALTAFQPWAKPRANHPVMYKVYDWAAKKDLPVLVHNNITCLGDTRPLYVGEMQEALRDHPATRFIWAHAGSSRDIYAERHEDVVRGMLATYSNLSINISWSEMFKNLLKRGSSNFDPGWIKLILDYPDRFLLGSDAVGKKGLGDYSRLMDDHRGLLEALNDPKVAEKLSWQNAVGILPARWQSRITVSIL